MIMLIKGFKEPTEEYDACIQFIVVDWPDLLDGWFNIDEDLFRRYWATGTITQRPTTIITADVVLAVV